MSDAPDDYDDDDDDDDYDHIDDDDINDYDDDKDDDDNIDNDYDDDDVDMITSVYSIPLPRYVSSSRLQLLVSTNISSPALIPSHRDSKNIVLTRPNWPSVPFIKSRSSDLPMNMII
jgi:hypothetical protein